MFRFCRIDLHNNFIMNISWKRLKKLKQRKIFWTFCVNVLCCFSWITLVKSFLNFTVSPLTLVCILRYVSNSSNLVCFIAVARFFSITEPSLSRLSYPLAKSIWFFNQPSTRNLRKGPRWCAHNPWVWHIKDNLRIATKHILEKETSCKKWRNLQSFIQFSTKKKQNKK